MKRSRGWKHERFCLNTSGRISEREGKTMLTHDASQLLHPEHPSDEHEARRDTQGDVTPQCAYYIV